MKYGYGYERPDKEFRKYGVEVERVFIDVKATRRAERALMFQQALQKGDTLVLISSRDLGSGRELKALREKLADMGVEVEEYDPPKVTERKDRPRGMTDEAKAEAMRYWPHPEYSVPYIQRELERAGHGSFSLQQLNRGLGPRYKRTDR